MTLIQVMHTQFRALDPDASLAETASLMTQSGYWMLPVCLGPRLVGSLSLMDLVEHCAQADKTVRDAMTSSPYACNVETPLEEARDLLCRHRQPALCVTTSAGDLIGMIDAFEVIESLRPPQAFAGPEPEEVLRVRGVG